MSELLRLKLVTVIAERILRSRLVSEVRDLGARGFTLSEVTGEGSRGVRASEWEGSNIKLEMIVAGDVAESIVAHISATYFEYHAVIVYVQDVDVVRGDKYL
ncbi:nitrogen regulatory protein P-II [soil metagenome]